MSKTIVGRELDAQLDRLVTEQRQLMRRVKALEAASCETSSEADAFYTLLQARFSKAADEDETTTAKKVFEDRALTTGAYAAAAAALEEPTATASVEAGEDD